MKLTAIFSPTAADAVVWPDSVMVRSGKPVFLPSEETPYYIHRTLGVRISRIGKSVEERFACRYYDSLLPAAIILPGDASDAIEEGKSPLAADTMFDGCIVIGDAVPVTEGKRAEIDRCISVASDKMMLKIGDIVFMLMPGARVKAQIDSRYEYSLSDIPGHECIGDALSCDDIQNTFVKLKIK